MGRQDARQKKRGDKTQDGKKWGKVTRDKKMGRRESRSTGIKTDKNLLVRYLLK